MTILKKLDYFVKKGYSKQAIKLITVKVPSVFNYSREGLDEKTGILKEADMEKEIITRPSYLIQGVNLSYARLKFMRDKNFTLNHQAFNYLVLDSKAFKNKFGVSNDEIKKRYPYKR